MKSSLLIFSIFFWVACDSLGGFSPWEDTALTMFVYFLLSFLMDLGKKIVIMDLTLIMAALTCLLVPVIFYHVYTKANPLARLWGKYMPISSNEYFSFAVPAIIALWIGLKIPLGKDRINKEPKRYMDNVKRYLNDKPKLGMTLIAVGFASGLLNFLAPANLKQVFYLSAHLTHVGVFYAVYSPNKYKRLAVPGVILLVIAQSILTGMFGELIFMLATSLILVLLGKNMTFRKKLTFAIAGLFLIFLLQSVKQDYRRQAWSGGADPFYFASLIGDRVSDPSFLVNPNFMFFTAVRMNQGWLVAETISRVPAKYSFAYGETIWVSMAATVIPRFLWPDKPETGGKANLKRFWGFDLIGFSTNIGILGEAYANFDRLGGIIYLFFYGLFFNLVLSTILKLSEKTPSLVLWIPFFFFNAIAVETDLLSTMGALVKSLIFCWIVFTGFKKLFNISL